MRICGAASPIEFNHGWHTLTNGKSVVFAARFFNHEKHKRHEMKRREFFAAKKARKAKIEAR